MMGPNCIVAGTSKAGTTWLYHCLREHPEVFVPTPKELHFFSRVPNYQRGLDWYYSFFEACEDESVIVDICPSYIFLPEVPPRIHRWNPKVKIIIILRNPIERAYSVYCMKVDHGTASRNIDQELSLSGHYVQRSLYFQQIQEYLKYFPKEQIKILLFDDLKNNPSQFLHEVHSFLGVDPHFQPSILNQPENVRKRPPKYMSLYAPLRSAYMALVHQYPKLEILVQELRRKGYLTLFYTLTRGGSYPELSVEAKASLATFFHKDVQQLSAFLQRDLSHWLTPYIK